MHNRGMDLTTEHQADHNRFVLRAGVEVAAYAEYFDTDGVRNFFHTVTLPQYRGRGFAAVLTEFALDDTRVRGLSVEPSCWFVREFIETNAAKYGDLVTSDEPRAER